MKFHYKHKMTVAAHRGDSYNYFENTMEAFRAAIEAGVDMVETDVRVTKDKVLVLIHDETIQRTAGKPGVVAEMTYEELSAQNVGVEGHPCPIPTLEELFQLLEGTGVWLNLEIKEYKSEENQQRCDYCIEESLKLVEKYGYGDKMIFNSFDGYVLETIYKRYGKRYMLHGFYPYNIMKNVEGNPDEYLYCACIFDHKDPEKYKYLLSKGIEPWVGAGVTDEFTLKACWDMGAVLVTTNYPADAIAKLKRAGLR